MSPHARTEQNLAKFHRLASARAREMQRLLYKSTCKHDGVKFLHTAKKEKRMHEYVCQICNIRFKELRPYIPQAYQVKFL